MDEFRKQIIKTWMDRADERYRATSPGFNTGFFHADNLIFCCIAYEAYAFGEFEKARMSENRKDLSTKFQNSFEQLIENGPPENFKEALKDLKEEIDAEKIADMTPNSNRPSLDFPDEKDLDRVLEIIYRVRSNLLHGGKEVNPSMQRNMRLIKSSFVLLYHIMNLILEQEGLT